MTEQHTRAGRKAGSSSKGSSSKRTAKLRRAEKAREGPLTVFIHIPKTAGTTLTSVLRANFPPGSVRVIGNVFHGAGGVSPGPVLKLRESGAMVTRDIHLLGGHLPFGIRDYLPSDTRYITFLRNPIERTLSQYYRLLLVRKRSPVPEGTSLEEILGGGEYLYDNLQTRMLSGVPQPFGEVTKEMLEQAKENLASGFVAFGLADRFDESLVLLKRRLGLRSIVYVTQRMTTNRPRTVEAKEDLVPVVERFNQYDLELYQWAAKKFDEIVSEQDADFAADLAALRTAVSNRLQAGSPPAASRLSRGRLWEELVSARAALLGWEFESAKANQKGPLDEGVADLRGLLERMSDRIAGIEAKLGALDVHREVEAGGPELVAEPVDEPSAKRRRVSGRPRGARLEVVRDRKEAHLEELRKQVRELEAAVGETPGVAGDAHVVRELERLRGHVAEVEGQIHEQQERVVQRGEAQEGRRRQSENRERQRRIGALSRTRDSAATRVEQMERRVKELQEELLERTKADGPNGDEGPLPARRQAKVERLQALVAQKESEIEELRQQISAADRELSDLNGSISGERESRDQPPSDDQASGEAVGPTEL